MQYLLSIFSINIVLRIGTALGAEIKEPAFVERSLPSREERQ